MRVIGGRLLSRRACALLLGAAAVRLPAPPAARAAGRTTAQTVGIESDSLLGIVWGGRDRCDPTDAGCVAGGRVLDAEDQGAQPLPAKPYTSTARVDLTLSVQGQPAGTLTLGLWGEEAPGSVDAFCRLAEGSLTSRPGEEPASLERSTLLRVDRDKTVVLGGLTRVGGSKVADKPSPPQSSIATRSEPLQRQRRTADTAQQTDADASDVAVLVPGQTRPQRVPVAPPVNADANAVVHDAAGLVSVRKGGGSFVFELTPRPNRNLDREHIVIGQVLNLEGMQLLERLNSLATNNYNKGALAVVKVERARVLPP